ncbi:oligosaccharide flippase family protein [Staphylococcus hyicus]|uniref:oligosaccharide flippase family protein n=1 Tax=Staphylococcus hyicus TaxID=1284 RepID=UPI001F1DA2AB|nr:oligosaccharide flippase family protein [Staphylococcus hyicus]MCE5153792.1 oligosaccharide flippase family protein [Staphylococcus hyicus]MCQ9291246.1 oligosaccharide flippase family protein [Staphylococcus hyicus]MCQ9306487.1 oligosaccharide flippase family protein [Staphylococcus hyicus]MCQ9308900.1 oligosaccharide flippase family protein [Staphylococcus hyicus]MCQ9311321.1 oligosaccharide flippase family protein [Staphylococcus hyicus]
MKQNKFFKDSIIMVLSSGIAQLLLIGTIPIISRLYSPSEFGEFTIFSNIAMVLIPIINARYDLLIINAKNYKQANILSQISFMISLFILLALLPLAIIYLIVRPEYLIEIIFLIIMLLLVSLTNIFTNYLNRERKYNTLSLINIFRALFMVVLQILFGFLNFGSMGLIIGFAFSYIAGITFGFKVFKNHFRYVASLPANLVLFKKYKNQLLFSTPSIFLNSLSFTVVVFFIGILFSNHEVGLYGMAIKILGVPITILSLGLSKIFMQKANDHYIAYGSFRTLLIKFSLILVIISIVVYVPFYIINDNLIVRILGSEWIDTVFIMKIIIPLFFIRLIVSTISLTVIVFEKQHIELMLQACFLIVTVITFFIAKSMSLNLESFLIINTIGLFIAYVVFYIATFYFAKNKFFNKGL